MGKPFKVTIDLGGGSEVNFDLTEADLTTRASRDPRLQGRLASAEGRSGFRLAAHDVVLAMLKTDDGEKVIKIHRDESRSIVMIPVAQVRSIERRRGR